MADQRRLILLLAFFLSLWIKSGDFSDECDEICPAVHYSATYNQPCNDYCDKYGYDYYWCHTSKGWDYCSPGINIDYKGEECLSSRPCGKYLGKESYNCVNQWMYLIPCGRVEPKAMIQYTIYLEECVSECWYYASDDYFWCYTKDSWSYCSPSPDVTYRNVACRSNSQCGKNGQTTYSWCYTTYNNNWDYCGVISSGECSYSDSSRRKRQPEPTNSNVICTREDQNTRVVTEFRQERGRSMAATNNRQLTEALDLINQWEGQGLSDQARSNLVHSDHFRLDNQGMCTRDNQRCYNLQVQINGQRLPGESTTVAQIIVPVDSPNDYMRLALRESLERGVQVVVGEQNQPQPGPSTSGKKKKCCKRRKR